MEDLKGVVIETGFVVALQVKNATPTQRAEASVEVASGDKEYEFVVPVEKGEELLQQLKSGGRMRVALVVLAEEPVAERDLAERIVDDILKDATDRRGWRQEWDGFDKDIKKEIRAKWASIVRDFLAGVTA